MKGNGESTLPCLTPDLVTTCLPSSRDNLVEARYIRAIKARYSPHQVIQYFMHEQGFPQLSSEDPVKGLFKV